MKSKVRYINYHGVESNEILKAEPYEAIKFICKLRNITFEASRLIGIKNGFEYSFDNKNIIQAYQI